ncbi:MAG: DUF1127 domain-containing protein [Pseudomonadota bacterium]
MTGKIEAAFKDTTRRDSFWVFIRKSLSSLADGILRYQRYRRDYAELQKMPDYMLKDIGLEREDVSRAQREHKLDFYGAPWK